MTEKIHVTPYGNIHYYLDMIDQDQLTLVMLPGLTADHRLFDKQVEYFKGRYNLLLWDAPGHLASRPFKFKFRLKDKASWLNAIFEAEDIRKPVIVGQSMGAYVGQNFMQYFPGKLKGFISIDSAPLQRSYITAAEILLLERMEPVYRWYPWKLLVKQGAEGCAETEYGRKVMADMMSTYEPKEYAKLAGHGYWMLADSYKADLPYKIDCPALLICGEKDVAGSTRKYNKKWHEVTGIPIAWIKDAGHNSNTDQPEEINELIENFIHGLTSI